MRQSAVLPVRLQCENFAQHINSPGWQATLTTSACSACSLLLSSRTNSRLHSLLWPCEMQFRAKSRHAAQAVQTPSWLQCAQSLRTSLSCCSAVLLVIVRIQFGLHGISKPHAKSILTYAEKE